MSILLTKLDGTEDFISKENFCVIRNDLKYFLKPQVIKTVSDADLEEYSEEDFQQNLSSLEEALERDEEISEKFNNLEDYANYSAALIGPAGNLAGISFRVISFLTEEGISLQAEIFEKLRFGDEDNPDLDELYYRDIWNHTVAKSSVISRMLVWSLIFEVSSHIYNLSIDGILKYHESGSKIKAMRYIQKNYRRR